MRYGDARCLSTDATVGEFYIVHLLGMAAAMAFGTVLMIIVAIGGGVAALGFISTGSENMVLMVILIAVGVLLYLTMIVGCVVTGKVCTTMLQQRIWDKAALSGQRFGQPHAGMARDQAASGQYRLADHHTGLRLAVGKRAQRTFQAR